MEIKARTNYEAWVRALECVYEEGLDFTDQEKRVCREQLNLSITIEDPQKNPLKPIQVLNSFQKWVYPDMEEIRNIVESKLSE